MVKHKGGIGKMLICEECTFIFQLHSIRVNMKRVPFCPSCGDNYDVSPYIAERVKMGEKMRWTEQELEMLKPCLTGKIAPHQVAIQLGRSIDSVKNRLRRLRKEG